MFAGVIGSLLDSIVKAAFSYFAGVMEKRGLIQQGQAQQAAKETASAEATEAAMGQAIADAPTTKNAALDRLKAGNG